MTHHDDAYDTAFHLKWIQHWLVFNSHTRFKKDWWVDIVRLFIYDTALHMFLRTGDAEEADTDESDEYVDDAYNALKSCDGHFQLPSPHSASIFSGQLQQHWPIQYVQHGMGRSFQEHIVHHLEKEC